MIRFSKMSAEEVEEEEIEQGLIEWDWLGEDSPMMSESSEACWVLDRLCESLERYMRKQNHKIEEEGQDRVRRRRRRRRRRRGSRRYSHEVGEEHGGHGGRGHGHGMRGRGEKAHEQQQQQQQHHHPIDEVDHVEKKAK